MAVSQIRPPEQPQADSSHLFTIIEEHDNHVETLSNGGALPDLAKELPEPMATHTVRSSAEQRGHSELGRRGEIVAGHLLARRWSWGPTTPVAGYETDFSIVDDSLPVNIDVDVKTREYDALDVLGDRVDMTFAQNPFNGTVTNTEGADACNDLYILVEERSVVEHGIWKWATGRDIEEHAYSAEEAGFDVREDMHIVDRSDLRDWPIDWSRVVEDARQR